MSKEFTAKQKEIVARKLGYDGPMQGFDEFLQSSPALAMKYGMIADKYMAKGGMVKKYQTGGDIYDPNATLSALAKNATSGTNTGVTTMPGGVTDDTFGPQVVVYGPDGKMYGNPEQARKAGVTNYTTTPPDQTTEEKKRINPADRSKEMANMPLTTPPSQAQQAQKFATGTPATDDEIKNLYRSVLGREADTGGFDFYKTSGFSADQIRQQFLNSEEYKKRPEAERAQAFATGTPATDAEIASVYKDVFGREPDAAGLQFYKTSKFSPDQIRQQLLNSEEYKNKPTRQVPTTQYSETGVPQVGTVERAQAAQTEVTPEMQLDAEQYTAGTAPTAAVTTAQAAPAVAAPSAVTTKPVATVSTREAVQQAVAPLTAAQGVAPVIQAAQLTPEQMQAAMAQAQTLDQARQVQLAERRLQEGELVSGPTVDQQRVEQALAQTQAAQGRVSEEMTVQGQLTKLTADFDTRNPPPWAAGAVRAATAMLAQRGLGASSMAGQAIIQAAMESAIPIASADAAAYREMESQNLSNRQQVAVLSAQQRAQFLGQEFDQAFQTRVLNAAKIADVANMNFTAEQQVYLENARLAQSVDLANLNNRQATVIANAATIANMQTANLSARQQALVANAQNFLQMSVANMSNQQQMAMFKAQELTQSIMSDAAAENAARQFNASSQQQADQFNSQITTQVSQFNALQKNAMEQFNAGQANALAQFNSQMQAQREEFNVKNRTIIDQANAQLLAQISTANTAATNAANFENARAMNNMTLSQYNNEVQLYRDQVKMVFDSYERAEDRAASMATAVLQAELAREKIDAETSSSFARLVGSVLTGTKLGDSIIDAGKDFIKNLIGG